MVSNDDGRTWSEPVPIYEGLPPGVPNVMNVDRGQLIKTRDGVIVLIYADAVSKPPRRVKDLWDEARGDWSGELRSDVWTIRTLDEGKTWLDRQRMPPEWFAGRNGNFNYGISTTSGHIVFPLQPLLHSPGRWGTRTIVSPDNGKTWKPGNLIDLGGVGHHDGGFEATLAELSDGRLFMLLRTNLDRFWEAYSSDHGCYWREIRPSQIDASSAPGYLLNLASGRIVLVWNRLYPEGSDNYPRRNGAYSEPMASWHRRELSIAFSPDDGRTWTKPVVFARAHDERGSLSYPYVFERRPGDLWVVAKYGSEPRVFVSLREEDFT